MNRRVIVKGILFLLLALSITTLLPGCGGTEEEEPVVDSSVHTYEMDAPFVTNVNGNKKLFLRMQISLKIISQADYDKFQLRIHEAKNIILYELRQLTEDQVYDSNIQNTLGPQLVEKLRNALQVDISSVYFTEFIVT